MRTSYWSRPTSPFACAKPSSTGHRTRRRAPAPPPSCPGPSPHRRRPRRRRPPRRTAATAASPARPRPSRQGQAHPVVHPLALERPPRRCEARHAPPGQGAWPTWPPSGGAPPRRPGRAGVPESAGRRAADQPQAWRLVQARGPGGAPDGEGRGVAPLAAPRPRHPRPGAGHAPIHLVQATLGHASVATTSKYLHARPTDSAPATSACRGRSPPAGPSGAPPERRSKVRPSRHSRPAAAAPARRASESSGASSVASGAPPFSWWTEHGGDTGSRSGAGAAGPPGAGTCRPARAAGGARRLSRRRQAAGGGCSG